MSAARPLHVLGRLLPRGRRRGDRRGEGVLGGLMAGAPVGVAVVGRDLVVREANAAFGALTGRAPSDLAGVPLGDALPTLPPEVLAGLPDLLAPDQPLVDVPLGADAPDGPHRVANISLAEEDDGWGVRVTVVDVTAQRRVEAALTAERDYARTVVDSMQDGLVVVSADRRLVDVNRRFCEITGWARDQLVGVRPPFPYWPPESAEVNGRMLARVLEDGTVDGEAVIRAADGRRLPVLVSGSRFTGAEGEVTGFVVTFKDIAARRLAEESLQRTERLKGAIIEAALDCVVSVDADGRIVDWNPAAERTFGHRREDVLGADMAELIVPEDQRAGHRRGFAHHLATGEGHLLGRRIEISALRGDGEVFPVELTVTRVETGGAPVFTAYLRDVSERHRAQEALAESERRFRTMADSAPVLLWTTGADGRCDFLNDGWLRFTGRSLEDSLGLGWLADVHPDDREAAMDAFVAAVARRAPFDNEFRLRGADGVHRWHMNRARPRLTSDGRLLGYIGSCTDITDRRLAEEQAHFLSEAGAALARSLDIESTLAEIAALAVPRVADGCILSLAGADGSPGRVAAAHVVAETAKRLEENVRRRPPPPQAILAPAKDMPAGVPVRLADVPARALRDGAAEAAHLEALRRLGVDAYVGVPLVARGRTLGAMGLLATEPHRRLSPADLALAEELATRAALAIDNAASHRAAEQAGTRARRLAAEQGALRRVATAVAAENNPRQVLDLVAAEVARLLDGGLGAVVRFDGDEASIGGLSGASRDALGEGPLPLTGPGAGVLGRVAATGRPARSTGAHPLGGRPVPAPASPGREPVHVAVPVHLRGRVWGAVLVERDGGVGYDAEELLGAFAGLVALAIANSEAWGRLGSLAATDALTGLANHRTFHDRLSIEVRRARRHGRPLALALIDIDHFKRINDAFGHRRGDAVLAEVGRRLGHLTRGGEVVARVGGEEFAWVLPESDALGAYSAGERARQAIAGTPFAEVGTVTVSIGVCDLEEAGGDAEALLRLADGALYWAKENGRDLTCRYSPEVVEDLSGAERASRLQRGLTLAGLNALARAVDAKDRSTSEHSARVAALAERLAARMGWTSERAGQLREAALLHDVGKLGVPDAILLKAGRLTAAEYEAVKGHAALGAAIAAEVLSAEQVAWVRAHHERPDGTGYPDGLAGEELPDGARVLSVADAWDAMTIARPYAAPLAPRDALAELRRRAGSQFDPAVVEAMGELWDAGEAPGNTAAAEERHAPG